MNSAAPLPVAGWEMRVDPATRRCFYVDHNTRTTHWELPAPVLAAFPLPPMWEARVDRATGAIFYANHATRSTTWQYPGTAPAANPPLQPQPPQFADPRVAELVSIGIAPEAATAAAAADPSATARTLIERIVLSRQQQQQQQQQSVLPPPQPPQPAAAADAGLCKACREREADVLLIPCSHMALCESCAAHARVCPVCGSGIQRSQRVYRA